MSYFDRIIVLDFVLKSDVISSFSLTSVELDMDFETKKTDNSENNSGSVSIFNLSPDKIEAITGADTGTVTVSAGYTQGTGASVVYSGDIIGIETPRERGDRKTTIKLSTGATARREGEISRTWKGVVTLSQVVTDLLTGSEVIPPSPLGVGNEKWNRGLSLSGNRIDLLTRVLNGQGYRFTIDDNNMKIFKLNSQQSSVTTIVSLTPSSGLLDSPERMTKQIKAKATRETQVDFLDRTSGGVPLNRIQPSTPPSTPAVSQTASVVKGWKIKSLLNPLLTPQGKVSVTSETMNGIFSIREVTHSGSTYSSEFNTVCEVY